MFDVLGKQARANGSLFYLDKISSQGRWAAVKTVACLQQVKLNFYSIKYCVFNSL